MKKYYVNIIDNSDLNESTDTMEPFTCDTPPTHSITIGKLSFIERWLYKLFKIKPKNKMTFEDVFGLPDETTLNERTYDFESIKEALNNYNPTQRTFIGEEDSTNEL